MQDDEYRRLGEKIELSYEEASVLNKEMQKRPSWAEEVTNDPWERPVKERWRVTTGMTNIEAANFLNTLNPLPGQVFVTNRGDGTVDIYWYR
jgi:hypothetical protein